MSRMILIFLSFFLGVTAFAADSLNRTPEIAALQKAKKSGATHILSRHYCKENVEGYYLCESACITSIDDYLAELVKHPTGDSAPDFQDHYPDENPASVNFEYSSKLKFTLRQGTLYDWVGVKRVANVRLVNALGGSTPAAHWVGVTETFDKTGLQVEAARARKTN